MRRRDMWRMKKKERCGGKVRGGDEEGGALREEVSPVVVGDAAPELAPPGEKTSVVDEVGV